MKTPLKQIVVVYVMVGLYIVHSDEGITLETSALVTIQLLKPKYLVITQPTKQLFFFEKLTPPPFISEIDSWSCRGNE